MSQNPDVSCGRSGANDARAQANKNAARDVGQGANPVGSLEGRGGAGPGVRREFGAAYPALAGTPRQRIGEALKESTFSRGVSLRRRASRATRRNDPSPSWQGSWAYATR